jgi:hypothetical protein
VESRSKQPEVNSFWSCPDLEKSTPPSRTLGKAGYAIEKHPLFSLFFTAALFDRCEDRPPKVQAAVNLVKTNTLPTFLF